MEERRRVADLYPIDDIGFAPVQFGDEKCASGHAFGPAVRTYWLLHYVVSGTGVFVREGKMHILKAGDLFVIPPYTETFYQADEYDPWEYIWVGFTVTGKLPPAFDGAVIRHAGVGEIFEEMQRCHKMENGKNAFLISRLWELIGVLLEQEPPNIDYVQKALGLIHAEYMEDITVSTIAKRMNLDRSYFSTLFKDRLGVPPGQYLMQYRLEKAAELLTVYGEKASVACVSVGYPDLYHFSKMFKAYYGVSPRGYQKRYKQKQSE